MNYKILANSSNGDVFYEINVNNVDGTFAISCNCKAGEMGMMCKHRVAVITGEYGKIIDIENPENFTVKDATKFIADQGITERYLTLTKELIELQKRFKADEKAIKLQINKLAD